MLIRMVLTRICTALDSKILSKRIIQKNDRSLSKNLNAPRRKQENKKCVNSKISIFDQKRFSSSPQFKNVRNFSKPDIDLI